MSRARWIAVAAAAWLLPLAARGEDDFREAARKNIADHVGVDEDDPSVLGTPFRKALKAKLQDRQDHGKKTPKKLVMEPPQLFMDPDGLDEDGNPIGWGPGDCPDRKRCPKAGFVVKYKAATKFKYDGPDEIVDPKGPDKPEWPPLKVEKLAKNPDTGAWEPVLGDDGLPVMQDFGEEYKAKAAAEAAKMDPPQIAWKVDPKDPNDPGLYEFGQEPQEEDVTEEITFTFEEKDKAQGEAFFRQLAAAMEAGASAEDAILMGFTWRGPNIDYTIGSSKRVCFFGCFTLWDIRAGFALDFGVGLRAPALSRLSGPTEMIAGGTYDFTSVIETTTQGDWKPGDWGVPEFDAVSVDPFDERGEGGAPGNEFVMYFEFFAGAKVEILEINVCPWCQYVEISKDYSRSYETPFGGVTTFPIPTVDIPVKDFNYGIVALTVGLYVTPQLSSTSISAVADGSQVIAHAASGVPKTFPVKACIRNEAPAPRWQTISLDEYRYNFDYFKLVLGAYLDFSVAGYGVWNPRFDFLTLDLSSALKLAGIYLPDHRSCNVAFQCSTLAQGVSLQSQLLDQSPPVTGNPVRAPDGKNGWYVTDVSGTLVPKDLPDGCGAGVASTAWGLEEPLANAGTTFELTYEDVRTLRWSSTDKDGNVEPANARVVKIDKTPPTISGAPTKPAVNGWYNEDVTVHFVAEDATSKVAFVTPDKILSAEAAGQSQEGTAEDFAGLTKTFTVTGINIDKTAPAVAIVVPAAKGYESTATLAVTWTATDALSGVEKEAADLDGAPVAQGQVIELIYLGGGNHEVHASATDVARNTGSAAVTFLVDVDIDGLLAAVDRVCADGWAKASACSSLRAKVLEAKASLALGYANDARGQLGAFVNALDAQRGKALEERAWSLLRVDALYVLVRYGLVPAV